MYSRHCASSSDLNVCWGMFVMPTPNAGAILVLLFCFFFCFCFFWCAYVCVEMCRLLGTVPQLFRLRAISFGYIFSVFVMH